KTGTGVKNGYPTYEFALDNFVSKTEEISKEINPLDAIKIFPNPYCCAAENGGGQVQIVHIPENARVLLFDLQGRLLKNWSPAEIKNSEISWQPAASGLYAGVYFFKITDEKGNTKVLKWAVADK